MSRTASQNGLGGLFSLTECPPRRDMDRTDRRESSAFFWEGGVVQRAAIVIRHSPHQTFPGRRADPIAASWFAMTKWGEGGKEGQTKRIIMKRTNERGGYKATPPWIIHSRFSPRLARSTHLRSIVEVRHAVAEAAELARREKLEVPRLVQRPDQGLDVNEVVREQVGVAASVRDIAHSAGSNGESEEKRR